METPNYNIDQIYTMATSKTYTLFLPAYGDCKNNDMRVRLSQAAAIIHEARQYCETKGISFKKSAFFRELADVLKSDSVKYLPHSWRNLRDRIETFDYRKPTCEVITAKNTGNKNARKISGNNVIVGSVIELGKSEKNHTSASIHRKLQRICQQNQFEMPSLRWVSDFLAKPENKFLTTEKYGTDSRFAANYRPYVPMKTALYAGDCWQIDGTRVNITDHLARAKDGKTMRKYLYIVAVRDVMSGLPLGWEYCHEESAQAVTNALANAVRNVGYLPYELVYDRFPGHNTADWKWVEDNMQEKGVLMTKTSTASGKANIERWFGTLQSVFMSESDYYYGEGVKSSRRYAHRTKEYVQQMRQWALANSFSFDDACRETDRIIEAYSLTRLNFYSRKFHKIDQSPVELHNSSDKPNTIHIEDNEFCYLFGLRKGISIRNYMIQTQIDNAIYYYGIDNCAVVEQYTGRKVTCCFDVEDYSRVHLYFDNMYLGTFAELPAAQRYGKDRDMRGVGIAKAIGKKMSGYKQQRLTEIENSKNLTLRELTFDGAEDEITLMSGGRAHKYDYETAESNYLNKQWEEDEEVAVYARAMY